MSVATLLLPTSTKNHAYVRRDVSESSAFMLVTRMRACSPEVWAPFLPLRKYRCEIRGCGSRPLPPRRLQMLSTSN